MTWAYEQMPATFNVAEILLGARSKAPDDGATAFLWDAEKISYGELRREVAHAAGFFVASGLRPGDRIVLVLRNGLDFVLAFLGALWMGAIPVPVSIASTPAQVRLILDDCSARFLLITEEELKRIGAWAQMPSVVLANEARAFSSAYKGIEQARAWYADAMNPALLLYTSGSTGRPKGVLHAQRSMLICAELYADSLLAIRPGDVAYSASSMSFAYGLGSMLYFPLATGSAAVLSSATNAFEISGDLRRYRPSIVWATPYTYAKMIDAVELVEVDFSSVRLCVSASERLSPSLWARFRDRFGLEICEGLGTTELLHVCVSNRPSASRPGTPGCAVPGYEVRVVDIEGRPMETAQVGELEVSGESRMLGYWGNTLAVGPGDTGIGLRTGDRSSIDNQGYVHLLGRTDDLLKVNGLWVAPAKVEEAIADHPGVEACAVVGCPSASAECTSLTAFIVARPGRDSEVLAREIKRVARDRLPTYMVPHAVRIVMGLPQGSTGKVDRRALRERMCP